MNYNLNQDSSVRNRKISTRVFLWEVLSLITEERKNIGIGFICILLNSGFKLLSIYLIGYAIDHYIEYKLYDGVLLIVSLLFVIYILSLVASYFQNKLMIGMGLSILFTIRNNLFNKMQELPISFFKTNKIGDLISRINNDTDKLNKFFSSSLLEFIGGTAMLIGGCVFLLLINFRLGIATLLPAIFVLFITRLMSGKIRKWNALSLKNSGELSAHIHDNFKNFRVFISFNRIDYFKKCFQKINDENYDASLKAGLGNNMFLSVHDFFSNLAQLIILLYGIRLVSNGELSAGLFVSYFIFAAHFYMAVNILVSLWPSFQLAISGWERIDRILSLESNLLLVKDPLKRKSSALVELKNVFFSYNMEKDVLSNVSISIMKGKTYAFIGPTGGGKTTIASLIARLYDPVKGEVLLEGKDIRSYTSKERSKKIGFIQQEPFLFTGTVKENILYGNELYHSYSNDQFNELIKEKNLESLISFFDKGLATEITSFSDKISLGQKQLIVFMRAILLEPALLILDEATANVDTKNERLLNDILDKLPASTTKIIIAHRLNTIKSADEIYFVNHGRVTQAESFDEAVHKINKEKRVS